jgi:hypothetical protein
VISFRPTTWQQTRGKTRTRNSDLPARLIESGDTSSAGDLVQGAIGDFIVNIGAAYAFPKVFSSGLQLGFDGHGSITAPSIIPSSTDAGFIGEGQPIPVRQMVSGGVTLTPTKVKTISVFNRELFEHNTPKIVKVVGASVTETVGLLFDSVGLDTNAATTTRPAGLRYQVAEPAHERSATGDEAMIKEATLPGTTCESRRN